MSLQFSQPLPRCLGLSQHAWLWGRLRIYSSSHTDWGSSSPARPLRGSPLHSLNAGAYFPAPLARKTGFPGSGSCLFCCLIILYDQVYPTEISHTHVYTLIRSQGFLFLIPLERNTECSQSFSSVWCHCGVKQLGLPWGRA